MKHQLQPNTYTVCEFTEQCKELFEWAKANGIKTSFKYNGSEMALLFLQEIGLYAEYNIGNAIAGLGFIPLPEFISRLKGEWVDGVTIKLTKDEAETILWAVDLVQAKYEDANFSNIINLIKQQLNQQ